MISAQTYTFGHGFAFRKEGFGGILYHYEGIQPDPRLYFVDSPFLVGLLETLAENPDLPLETLLLAVRDQFALDAEQEQAMRDFFQTLTERGALVPNNAE